MVYLVTFELRHGEVDDGTSSPLLEYYRVLMGTFPNWLDGVWSKYLCMSFEMSLFGFSGQLGAI